MAFDVHDTLQGVDEARGVQRRALRSVAGPSRSPAVPRLSGPERPTAAGARGPVGSCSPPPRRRCGRQPRRRRGRRRPAPLAGRRPRRGPGRHCPVWRRWARVRVPCTRSPEGRRTPMDAVQPMVTSAGAGPAAAEYRACAPRSGRARATARYRPPSAAPARRRSRPPRPVGDAGVPCAGCAASSPGGRLRARRRPGGAAGAAARHARGGTDGGHRVHPRSAPCASSSADGSMAS